MNRMLAFKLQHLVLFYSSGGHCIKNVSGLPTGGCNHHLEICQWLGVSHKNSNLGNVSLTRGVALAGC